MKIICTKSNLAKGVSIVSKAVPSKTTMPILECILIDLLRVAHEEQQQAALFLGKIQLHIVFIKAHGGGVQLRM